MSSRYGNGCCLCKGRCKVIPKNHRNFTTKNTIHLYISPICRIFAQSFEKSVLTNAQRSDAKRCESMTTLSKSEKDSMMKDMKSFDEPMPSVGIFWYDPQEHDFFGVYKKELTPKMVEDAADKGLPFINYQTLRRQIWQKQYFRALAKHEPTRFSGDYTQVPRGRVAWNIDKFIVFVGQWAKDKEDELTELIEKYFALPYFEFRYDEHWDLGHGWSGDM